MQHVNRIGIEIPVREKSNGKFVYLNLSKGARSSFSLHTACLDFMLNTSLFSSLLIACTVLNLFT